MHRVGTADVKNYFCSVSMVLDVLLTFSYNTVKKDTSGADEIRSPAVLKELRRKFHTVFKE